jgi:hypothetical protein
METFREFILKDVHDRLGQDSIPVNTVLNFNSWCKKGEEFSSLQIKEAIEEIKGNSSPLLSKEYVLEILNSKMNGK